MFARRAFKQGTGMNTDTFFDGAAEDSLFGAERLEPGETQTAALFEPGPILPSPLMQSPAAKVEIPEGQSVVRVTVAPGETVELPFAADAQFLVRLGDGNLAIKVGDITIILEGYADASGDPAHPIVIHSADGAPLDIASLLAATDPDIEIETAAGPGNPGGPGTDNTGAIFQQLDETGDGTDGTPGSTGAQDETTGPAGGDPADAGGDPNQARSQNEPGSVNAAPETSVAAVAGLEDAVSIAVPLSGLDSDGFVALFAVTSLPAGGTLYADAALTVLLAVNDTVPAAASAATVYFVPDANFNGGLTFQYAAIDNAGLQDTTPATATIAVTPVDDAPVAVNDTSSIAEDSGAQPIDVLANDTDVDGGPLSIASVTQPANGTVVITGGGSGISYTPNPDYGNNPPGTTPDTFTYTLNGGGTATVSMIITVVDDAPLAVNDTTMTTEDSGALAIDVLANDTDIDGGPKSITGVTQPANGIVAITGGGTGISYTPSADYHGSETFTYTLNGGSTATVTVTVSAVNDAPVSVDDSFTVDEGGTKTVAILANDTDADLDPLEITVLTQTLHGTVTVHTDGTITYVHDGSETDSDSFTYKVKDGTEDGNIATVTITVMPVNDAPVATDDNYAVLENQSLIVTAGNRLLSNDTDAEGNPLTASLVSDPSHGTLTLNPNGTFTYTPNAGYHGTDSFTYKANDGSADSNTATVTITVNSVNDAPVAVADGITVAEGGTATILTGGATSVLANDTDADSDPLTAILVTGPTNGTLTLLADGTFSYAHNGGETTTDSFTYKANDGTANGNITTVSITVSPVNDAPVAQSDNYSTNEDQTLNVSLGNKILLNDTDAEGNPLTASLVSDPSHGTLTLNPNGTFTYTPNAGYHGTDSFTYKANDGSADSNTATVTITVNSVNDAPVAVADGITVAEGGTATILTGGATSVLANDTDADSDPLTAILVTGPTNGTLTLLADGTFSYAHNGGETTTDSFTYKVNDGTVDGNTTTVSITVSPVDDAPVATGDSYIMNENQSLMVTTANGLLLNDTDAEANALTASVVSNPAHGTLTLNPDGSFTYTPGAGYDGTDSFTYKANDGTADSNVATVTITVEAVPNHAPVANTDYIIVAPGGTTTQLVGSPVPTLLFNDSDADGDPLTALQVQAPLHGTLTLNPNGTFSYIHDGSVDLYDSFTYKANDGSADSNTATVLITVQQPNLYFPVAVNDSIVLDKGGTSAALVGGAASVLDNDSDMDPGSTLTAVLAFDAAHGSVTLNPDGTFSYTHNGGPDLTDSFAYQVSDGLHLSMPAVVTIAINPPPPVDPGPTTIADNVVTNFGLGAPFQIPEWMLLYNDVGKDPTHLDVTAVAGAGFIPPVHTPGTGSDGYVTVTGDFIFGANFTYAATEGGVTGNTASVTVQTLNLTPGTISGTGGQDILIDKPGSDTTLNGGGSFGTKGDLIFAGDGDDSIFFHAQASSPIPGIPPSTGAGDVVYGGTDTVAKDNGLMAGLHGDVLVISELTTDFTHGFKLDSIEGIRADTSGMLYPHSITLNATNVIDMSDHTITPGGVFAGRDAIYINGGAVDHLYLSISDGGKWSDTGLTANDGLSKIYVHDTGAGAAGTSENAYVIVASTVGTVTLNQDA
jgi:VCBS repeat-containing protein